MVNQVFLIGRLVRDPELFETANKKDIKIKMEFMKQIILIVLYGVE